MTTAASTVVSITKPVFEKWFDKSLEKVGITLKTILKKDREHFWKYLERTYDKLLKIRPVGFREQLDFLKIYIPLSIYIKNSDHDKEMVIKEFPKNLIRKRTLIVDNAGMGKSTIAKRLFIGAFEDGSCGIPILVELRHLSAKNNILQEILHQIGNLSSEFDERLLTTLVEQGGFIFFLDGYDEISYNERNIVTTSIRSFIEKAGNNNTFVLTSRDDDALSGFQSFDQYSIKQLEEQDAFQLLRNLDNNGEKSELLIRKLQSNELAGVEEFLINPLLVTLLFTAFDFKPTIPTKKYLFYDQVFNAFFQQHDLSKGDDWVHDKFSKLEKDDFERVLRCIGIISIMSHKIEFTRTEIIDIINEAKSRNRNLVFQPSDFLQDLTETVPLFTKEGTIFKWAHKSLAEYFAVEFIYRDSMGHEKEYVDYLYSKEGDRNRNLFDLYFDINPPGFREYLLLPCLKEIKDELLPSNENIIKRAFCTLFIGATLHIVPEKSVKRLSSFCRPLRGYSMYFYYVDWNLTDKWYPILSILLQKKYLMDAQDLPQTKWRSKNNAFEQYLDKYLDKYKELKIDSSNIGQFDIEIIFEILVHTEFSILSCPVLNRDLCEEEIKKIEEEIERKKNLISFKFKS